MDEDLRRIAGDITRKHGVGIKCSHDDNIASDEGKDGDGSMCEDLDKVIPAAQKRAGKGRNPMKADPIQWPPAELNGVRQTRYDVDQPEMRAYRRNYLQSWRRTVST